ncbi:MAG TPA: ester cyclase [Solirubrobacterales bacterium]|nr:ester cyclase [Solirubrobacterales bacterium]
MALAYFQALSDHDLERAVGCWASGARQNVRGQVDTIAPEGVREQMMGLLTAVPDFRFDVLATATEADRCAVQWRMRGTFAGRGFLYGIRPTGSELDLEGIDLFTIREGLIRSNDAFSDSMEFTRQIGMMPAQGSGSERFFTALFNLRSRLRWRRG